MNRCGDMRFACLLLAAFLAFYAPVLAEPVKAVGTVEVFFSPRGGATEAIVREIDAARREVLVLAYSFTSAPIAKALLQAHKRGIRVEAVLDKSQKRERYSSATFLVNARIPVYIDSVHAIAHNKVLLIDRKVLITGSFNFTKAAEEKNAENLLIIKGNEALVGKYLENYSEHKAHSEPYVKDGASSHPWIDR